MESAPYTVLRAQEGRYLVWYGKSDRNHVAKMIGHFATSDEAYLCAQNHLRLRHTP